MISITPQGSVYLCKTPLENDYKNQLTFANATAQQNYFTNLVVKTGTDYTYIKKDSTITVNYPIDEIIDCNYLFYVNTGFSNKYYYCFITNMEYVNENATRLFIETDVFQTYQFNIVKKSCFVEREHVNDDTIGNNTIKENLDLGEYVINDYDVLDEYGGSGHIFIGVTKLPDDIDVIKNIRVHQSGSTYYINDTTYNGIYNGLCYLAFRTNLDAANFIEMMDIKGLADAIVNVFIIPESIWNLAATSSSWKYVEVILAIGNTQVDLSFFTALVPTSATETVMLSNKTINVNSTLNGYTPKNNKLFTKQFNYLYITNNIGGDVTYAYEDFVNNIPKLRIIGAICPGASVRLIPENYKKLDTSGSTEHNVLMSYGLQGGKYPTCSWSSDTYTNWLTQQSVNNQITLERGVGIGLGAIISPAAAVGGAIAGALEGMTDMTGLRPEITPPQAKGNINTGDVTYSASMNRFAYFQMSIRYEYAKRIDDYFSAFGYRVNEFKIPNLEGRTNWNYVKTRECTFEGDIPQIYLNKIKEIFNNGITLWHNASTFLDYSQSNTIVS